MSQRTGPERSGGDAADAPPARVGIVHPGQMGAAVGVALRSAGAEVSWAAQGRSRATRERATSAGMIDVDSLAALAARSDVIVSVCPPDSALDVARSVAAAGFTGVFVDGNAVAPETARRIGAVVEAAGASFVDGAIIGPPPVRAGTTRLYLAGDKADEACSLFAGSHLNAVRLDGPPGAASALKGCFAAYTKGSAALLLAIRAVAAAEGVDDDLLAEWALSQPDLGGRSAAASVTAAKAWRFVGEMEEIAAAFAAAGLPDGFHRAAAEVYRRLERYKDVDVAPPLKEVTAALLGGEAAGLTPPRRAGGR